MRICLVTVMSGLIGTVAAVAADVPGAKDPSFLKRYAGSEIVFSLTRTYDAYALIVPDPKNAGKTTTESREGTITRVLYRIPKGHTALELFRNYEQEVKSAGFSIAYEALPCQIVGDDSPYKVFGAVTGTGLEGRYLKSPFAHTVGGSDGPFCFLTAKGNQARQDVALTVAVSEKVDRGDPTNYTFPFANGQPPVVFNAGELIVMVDIVTSKAVTNNMVTVKAADIADALATKGSIALYGIYFDVDKSEVKPESTSTLDEVASLLKIDRSLRLEVSGHTDRTGSPDHNVKLSEARAQAVVDALVKKYGISAARLQAKGYGDTRPVAANDMEANRAKNRRVELRKL